MTENAWRQFSNCLRPDSVTKLGSRINRRKEGKWWRHNLLFSPVGAGVSLLPFLTDRHHLSGSSHCSAVKVEEPCLCTSEIIMKIKSTMTGKWPCPSCSSVSLEVSSIGWRDPSVSQVAGGFALQKLRDPFPDSVSSGIFRLFNPLGKATGLFYSFCSWTWYSGHVEFQIRCVKNKTKPKDKTKKNNMIPSVVCKFGHHPSTTITGTSLMKNI